MGQVNVGMGGQQQGGNMAMGGQNPGMAQQRMMRPMMPNNQLRHLLQQQPQNPGQPFRQQMPNANMNMNQMGQRQNPQVNERVK
jgi:hypothetical protein